MEPLGLKVARNTLHNGVRQVAVMLAAICTSVVVARTLGPREMGVYGFTLWLVSLLSILANLGLPSAATKYISEYIGRGDPGTAGHIGHSLVSTQLLIAVGIAGLASLGGAILGHGLRVPLVIAALLVIPRALQQALSGVLAGAQRYDKIAQMAFHIAGGETACVLLGAALHFHVAGMIAATLVGSSIGLFTGFMSVRKTILWTRLPQPTEKTNLAVKRVMRFCVTVSYILLLNAIVWERSEVLFLKWFCTLPQIAFYSIAFSLSGKLSEIASVCTNTLMPVSSEAFGRGDLRNLRSIYRHGLRYVQMLMVPLCFFGIAVARPVVGLMYGPSYLPVAPILQILLGSVAFVSMGGVGSSIVYGVDRLAFVAKFGTAVAALNILLDICLIPRWGGVGAALANCIAQIAGVVGGLVYVQRILTISFPWKTIAGVYVTAASISVPILYASSLGVRPSVVGALAVLGFVLYGVALIALGEIGRRELALVRSIHPKGRACGPYELPEGGRSV